MNIKPQRIIIDDEKIDEEIIKPQKLDSSDFYIDDEFENKKYSKEINKKKKYINIYILILAVVLFLGLLIYDTTSKIVYIYESSLFFGLFFTLIAILFLFFVIKSIFNQIKSVNKLRNIEQYQKLAKKFQTQPTNQTKDFIKALIKQYKNDLTLKEPLFNLEKKIDEDLILNSNLIHEFEDNILNILDERAYKIINKNVNQTVLATTISPVVFIDALFVMYRNIAMISEIAKVYGFEPTLSFEISLTKQIFNSIIFASTSEIMSEYGSYLIGNSLIKKISLSMSNGIGNGILTTRIGFFTIKACRVIPNPETQKNKLKKIITKMMESMKIF